MIQLPKQLKSGYASIVEPIFGECAKKSQHLTVTFCDGVGQQQENVGVAKQCYWAGKKISGEEATGHKKIWGKEKKQFIGGVGGKKNGREWLGSTKK